MSSVSSSTLLSESSASSTQDASTSTSSPTGAHSSNVFSSSSLLFGLVFLAILIIFIGGGLLWQRLVMGRRNIIFDFFEEDSVQGRYHEGPPVLWDTYLRKSNGSKSWKDLYVRANIYFISEQIYMAPVPLLALKCAMGASGAS